MVVRATNEAWSVVGALEERCEDLKVRIYNILFRFTEYLADSNPNFDLDPY